MTFPEDVEIFGNNVNYIGPARFSFDEIWFTFNTTITTQ